MRCVLAFAAIVATVVGVVGVYFAVDVVYRLGASDVHADLAIQTMRANRMERVSRDRDQWRQIALQFEALNIDCLGNCEKEMKWTESTYPNSKRQRSLLSSHLPNVTKTRSGTVRMSTTMMTTPFSPGSSSSSSPTISYEEGLCPNVFTITATNADAITSTDTWTGHTLNRFVMQAMPIAGNEKGLTNRRSLAGIEQANTAVARHRPSNPPDAPPDCSFANPTNDAILKFYNDLANGWYAASLKNPTGYQLPSLFQCRGDLVKRMQDDRAADPLVWLYDHGIYMRDVYVWHSFTVTRDPALHGYIANVSYLGDVVGGETARELVNGDIVDDPDCDVCEVWFWYPMVQGTPAVVGWRKP